MPHSRAYIASVPTVSIVKSVCSISRITKSNPDEARILTTRGCGQSVIHVPKAGLPSPCSALTLLLLIICPRKARLAPPAPDVRVHQEFGLTPFEHVDDL